MAQWGQSTTAPGPLAPCLVGSSRGDSRARVVVPPVTHLMNIKIIHLEMERSDSLRSWFSACHVPLLDYYPSRQFTSCRKFLKCHIVIMSLSWTMPSFCWHLNLKFSEKVVDGGMVWRWTYCPLYVSEMSLWFGEHTVTTTTTMQYLCEDLSKIQ